MRLKLITLPLLILLSLLGCNSTDSKVASHNLSKRADNFQILRRTVFYNGITDKYVLSVTGYCSIKVDRADRQLELTCKTGEGSFKKHYLGLSDNLSYFSEQMNSEDVNTNHYEVTFKPQSILPDVDFRGNSEELIDSLSPDNSD